MRSHPRAAALGSAAVALVMLAPACSPANESTEGAATSADAPASEQTPAEAAQPGETAVSPDGITTVVAVPADATESQYGQACHAAKIWMDEQAGDPLTLVEPYLKVLQAPDFTGPGNFETPWVALTPAQQAGVIMAVNGAAQGTCQ